MIASHHEDIKTSTKNEQIFRTYVRISEIKIEVNDRRGQIIDIHENTYPRLNHTLWKLRLKPRKIRAMNLRKSSHDISLSLSRHQNDASLIYVLSYVTSIFWCCVNQNPRKITNLKINHLCISWPNTNVEVHKMRLRLLNSKNIDELIRSQESVRIHSRNTLKNRKTWWRLSTTITKTFVPLSQDKGALTEENNPRNLQNTDTPIYTRTRIIIRWQWREKHLDPLKRLKR